MKISRRQGRSSPAEIFVSAGTLQEAKWHLDRYDRLRASTASRGGVVLSANAVIVAGASLLVATYLKDASAKGSLVVGVVSLGVVATLLLASMSVIQVVRALISRKPWRVQFQEEAAPALFYNHGDTVRTVKNSDEFMEKFASQREGDALSYALTELWICIKLQRYRYDSLRRSILLLFAAILVFLVTTIVAVGVGFTSSI